MPVSDAERDQLFEDLKAQMEAKESGKEPKVKSIEWRDVRLERHHDGTIILPEGMSYRTARETLKQMEEDENSEVNVFHDFECFPLDGAWAFWKALKQLYGFVNTKPSWWSTTTFVSLEVSPGKYEQVPWGQLQPPGMEGVLETGFNFNGETPKFSIQGTMKKKYAVAVQIVADLTRKILKEESIYKGQAIAVDLAFMMGKARFNLDSSAPKFISFKGLTEDSLIVDEATSMLLSTEIWDRIELTDELIKQGIKIKHGVALAGPYGVGKTMAAMVTAIKATKHGWTYIYLKSADQIPVGLRFAKLFGNAVLFVEDVDRVTSGDRDAVMDQMFNAMDGVDNKDQHVIVVVTTNNLLDIHNGMMRAGRIDAVIEMKAPDGPTALRFIYQVLGKKLKPGEDLSVLGDKFSGIIPAFLQAACDKAALIALHRTHGKIDGEVIAADLSTAAEILKRHIALTTKPEKGKTITVSQAFERALLEIGNNAPDTVAL